MKIWRWLQKRGKDRALSFQTTGVKFLKLRSFQKAVSGPKNGSLIKQAYTTILLQGIPRLLLGLGRRGRKAKAPHAPHRELPRTIKRGARVGAIRKNRGTQIV